MNKLKNLFNNRIKDDTTRLFTKAFVWAGVAFIIIAILGLITNLYIDQSGVLKAALAEFNKTGGYNVDFYTEATEAAKKLQYVSYVAIGLILISSVLRFIWWFRFQTAGKTFILSTYTIYVIAQGLGFGLLFTLYQTTDLLIVFGVAGGMFALMAVAGWHAKDLAKLTIFLVYASIGMFIFGIIALIMYFTGGASNGLLFVYFLLGAMLTLIWIIWDVAMLKRFSIQNSLSLNSDPMVEFRIVTFFGFRLLSDLVTLIWTLARLMRYIRG